MDSTPDVLGKLRARQQASYRAAYKAGFCLTCPYSLICVAQGHFSKIELVSLRQRSSDQDFATAEKHVFDTMACRLYQTGVFGVW